MEYQSEQINELAAALSKAQGQMQNALMDKTNPFYKSKYADYNSIRDAVIIPLTFNNIAYSHQIGFIDGVPCLITTLMHASGQWIKSCFPMPQTKGDAQSMGSAISYLKRYSLSAMTGCAAGKEEDDDGEKAQEPHREKKQEQVSPMKKLYAMLAEKKIDTSKLPDFLKAKATESKVTIDQVVNSAINEGLFPRFTESYKAFLEE